MRVAHVLAAIAAAFLCTFSTANAASVTVQFPFAGSGWLDTASGDTGYLTSGSYTGKLVGANSFVDGLVTDPALKNFVITAIDPSINLYETQGDVIDIYVNGAEVQTPNTISACCGGLIYDPGILTLPTAVSGGALGQVGLDYLLDYAVSQTNPSAGNWIQFGEGSVTFYGDYAPTPEPATWMLLILGFGVVGTALRSQRGRTGRPESLLTA